jgi:hypothetical protein
MNCETSSQLISRLLDNDLSDAEQAALHEHLAQCPACEKQEWEQRRLHTAVRSVSAPDLPPDYSRRLREEIWRKVKMTERRPVSLSFRIMAIAAILILSTAVMLLAWRLHVRQKEARQPGVAIETAPRGGSSFMPLPAGRLPKNALIENGSAEQVQAFVSVQDYLGGAMRWMAIDGNQVEVGMSGSGTSTVGEKNAAREVVVVTLQYVERQSDNRTTILSNPQFVLLPGEEASVRLSGRNRDSRELFRYRVKAAKEKSGQISARIAFDCEVPDAAEQRPVIDSPINAEVMVKEETPVLLGASGDATRRHELYMWAGMRSIAANGRPSSGKGDHL